MSYCQNKSKAIVNYSFGNGYKDKFTSNLVPIDVSHGRDPADFTGGQCEEVLYRVTAQHTYFLDFDRAGSFVTVATYQGNIPGKIIGAADQYPTGVFGGFFITTSSFAVLHRNQEIGFLGFVSANPLLPHSSTDYVYNYIDFGRITNIVRVDNLPDTCGDFKGRCVITVKHQGNTIFTAQGEEPCNFSVACDDDCPPDHIRCEQPRYPGYCCLPCQPIAQRINNLAARIK